VSLSGGTPSPDQQFKPISHSDLSEFTTHLALAIREAKSDDADGKAKLPRRFAGYFLSNDSRRLFGVNGEHTNASVADVAQDIRRYFAKVNLVPHFIEFLKLGDSDLLNVLTFNISSSFYTALPDKKGFILSSFFSDSPSIAQIFDKINLFLEFIVSVYGNHFSYLRTQISDLVRAASYTLPAEVIIHQWAMVFQGLYLPIPPKAFSDLQDFIERHALIWDSSFVPTCLFVADSHNRLNDYTQASLLELKAMMSKGTAKPPLTSKAAKNTKDGLLVTGSGKPTNKTNIDFSPLQGFCIRFLRNGSCPQLSKNNKCQNGPASARVDLKHGPEFNKLSSAAKAEIKAGLAVVEACIASVK
jgi:hypothetical protein